VFTDREQLTGVDLRHLRVAHRRGRGGHLRLLQQRRPAEDFAGPDGHDSPARAAHRSDVESHAPRDDQEHILRHVSLAKQHLARPGVAHPRHVGDLQQMIVIEGVQKTHVTQRLDHCF
jgi:hypothetical protein